MWIKTQKSEARERLLIAYLQASDYYYFLMPFRLQPFKLRRLQWDFLQLLVWSINPWKLLSLPGKIFGKRLLKAELAEQRALSRGTESFCLMMAYFGRFFSLRIQIEPQTLNPSWKMLEMCPAFRGILHLSDAPIIRNPRNYFMKLFEYSWPMKTREHKMCPSETITI